MLRWVPTVRPMLSMAIILVCTFHFLSIPILISKYLFPNIYILQPPEHHQSCCIAQWASNRPNVDKSQTLNFTIPELSELLTFSPTGICHMLAQTNGDCNVMLVMTCTFINNLVQDRLRPSGQSAPGHVCEIFSHC